MATAATKRRSRTTYAILGFLADGPKSGYEIKQDIEVQANHFWSESFGQIYPVLKKLTAEELIEKVDSPDSGKRSRQRYAISALGLAELKEWIVDPAEYATIRSEFLLKLFFGSHVDLDVSLQHLEEYKSWHLRRQNVYTKYRQELAKDKAPESPESVYKMAVLEFGIESTKMALEWSQKTADNLKATAES